MNADKNNTIGTSSNSTFSKIEKVHPFLMMLYLIMAGITVLFLILIAAYLRTRFMEEGPINRHFPVFFSLSTLLMIASSITLNRVPAFYQRDDLLRVKIYLWATLLLGMGFVWSQVAGWREMAIHGVAFRGSASGTYVYLISALHSIHLLGGIIFLSFMLLKTLYASLNPIRTLVFIRNPYHRQQFNLLGTYWHYLDVLWMFLYLIFLFCN